MSALSPRLIKVLTVILAPWVAGMLPEAGTNPVTAASGHYYHILYAEDGNTYGGGSTHFDTRSLVASDSVYPPNCGHLNHTLWVDTNGTGNGKTNGVNWAEIGYTYGDVYVPGSSCGLDPKCGQTGYSNCMSFYDYWTNPANPAGTLTFLGGVPDSDLKGGHVYTIEQCASCYQIAKDGTIVTHDTGAQGWTDVVQVGLEGSADRGVLGAAIGQSYHELRTRACCSWGNWGTSHVFTTDAVHQASFISYPETGKVNQT